VKSESEKVKAYEQLGVKYFPNYLRLKLELEQTKNNQVFDIILDFDTLLLVSKKPK
jgi:hypothetical protein